MLRNLVLSKLFLQLCMHAALCYISTRLATVHNMASRFSHWSSNSIVTVEWEICWDKTLFVLLQMVHMTWQMPSFVLQICSVDPIYQNDRVTQHNEGWWSCEDMTLSPLWWSLLLILSIWSEASYPDGCFHTLKLKMLHKMTFFGELTLMFPEHDNQASTWLM